MKAWIPTRKSYEIASSFLLIVVILLMLSFVTHVCGDLLPPTPPGMITVIRSPKDSEVQTVRMVRKSNIINISLFVLGTGPQLDIKLVEIEDAPLVYDAQSPTNSNGGNYTFDVQCYSGIAYQIHCLNIGTNRVLLDWSEDLVIWHGFPADGFQRTLTFDDPVAYIPPIKPKLFFRGTIEH